MDKTDRGYVMASVLILAGLILYSIERRTYEPFDPNPAINPLQDDTKTTITGHDWIWDVEAVDFDYMPLEIVIAGLVLYATHWFISGG